MPTSVTENLPIWEIGERDADSERRLADALGVSLLTAAVLSRRGLVQPEQASSFLNPSLEDLHDPRLLPDYEPAARAILGARERGKTIFVHGDYDVDGVTSAALFTRFLGSIGCKVVPFVPNRMKDGYGLKAAAVVAAKAQGATLLLTCDCGIGAIEEVEQARDAGIQVVVTDHHEVGAILPKAEAVVNPHRADSVYPFTELSGAGVVFKLCAGLTAELGHPVDKFYRAFLDLAALGTIADVMPLVGENRVLARFGLEQLSATNKHGLRALIEESGVGQKSAGGMRAWHVGFGLGPRLNAAGRIDDASLALRLLLSRDEKESAELARTLEGLNERRKNEQEAIVEQAVERVLSQGLEKNPVIVVSGEGWHPGIVGIVAGKLVERFLRPVFVFTVDPDTGTAKGSARSIPAFNLAEAIREHPDLLSGGGHAAAAGFSAEANMLPQIESALFDFASLRLKPEDYISRVEVAAEIEAREATLSTAEELAQLEPFGCANPTPLFALRSGRLRQVIETRNPAHPQAMLQFGEAAPIRVAAFGMGERLTRGLQGSSIDVLVNISPDEFHGEKRVRWVLKDFRPSNSPSE